MKRTLCYICVVVLLTTAAVGCNRKLEEESAAITTPEEYCAQFDNADIIIGNNGDFYVEATHTNWVIELDLQDATPVAIVGRTGVTAQFEPWDATVLPVGTAINRHNSEGGVLVADRDGEPIPYLLYES